MVNGQKKICFVVQRYGREVNGGAEYLCRLYAERMAKYYEVTVLTSCAIDYFSWKNEYKEGHEEINGVKVIRFNVKSERDIAKFGRDMGAYVGKEDRDCVDDFQWMLDSGPQCPELLSYLMDNKDQFFCFLFMSYLYYTTTLCMHTVANKAILISTAHDEVPLNACRMFCAQFNMPAGFMYLTEEEKDLVHHKFGNERIPYAITGSGVNLPSDKLIEENKKILIKNGISKEYVCYIGRIEEGKSCDLLFECFGKYKEIYGGSLKMVLAGKAMMEIPNREDIVPLGFVSEEEKFAIIKNAKALILASRQESLSLVVLEAMALGVPVMVNANCTVLKGHIDKSNAGLYFYKQEDFIAVLRYLLTHDDLLKIMSENGRKYIADYYSWDVIDQKMIGLIERVSGNDQ